MKDVDQEAVSPVLALVTKRLVQSLRVAAQATRVVEAEVPAEDWPEPVAQACEAALEHHPALCPLELDTVDGALFELATVHPPQVAVLSAGTPVDRVVVRDGAAAVRRVAYLALSYDQRLVEPDEASAFLADVQARLSG